MAAARSEVLAVMLQPTTAYVRLSQAPEPTVLAALRRPAFFALLIGSSVALSASGRFTLRLLASTTVLWSFAPALQLLAAATVVRLLGRRRLSLAGGIDLYFVGIGPWSLWLVAMAGFYSFVSAEQTSIWTAGSGFALINTAVVPLLWSALITWGFLRGALGLDRKRACLGFVLHGALVWGPVFAFFLFSGHLFPRLVGLLAR